jgi:cystathionine beta-synthase
VADHATAAPLVERHEDPAEAVRRLEAEGFGDEDVVLAAYRRDGRLLAPHSSDLLGWTTLGRLRGAVTVAGTVRPFGPGLGIGLPLSDRAVTAWDRAEGEVAPVLDRGRVTGTVLWRALHPIAAQPGGEPNGKPPLT